MSADTFRHYQNRDINQHVDVLALDIVIYKFRILVSDPVSRSAFKISGSCK